jgi:radical SAM-linked protein
MVGDKIRFRFRKSGDLRLLSHLDLTRCFERMLRRADLPFRSSQGFHPTPRMIFALSLPLGVVGDCEVLELELLNECDIEEVRERLNRQTPQGLSFQSASAVPMKTTAMPRRVQYSLDVPDDRVPETRNRIRELLDSPKVWVDRLKPRPRQLNVRPYLRDITLEARQLLAIGFRQVGKLAATGQTR